MGQEITTALITVAIGILVFVLGQIVLVLFIERIRLQARTIEEIAESIVRYGSEYSVARRDDAPIDPGKQQRLMEASDHLRRLAARLRSTAVTLRWYRFFELLRLVHPRRDVIEASKSLIGLSNCIPPQTVREIPIAIKKQEEVESFLKIGVLVDGQRGETVSKR